MERGQEGPALNPLLRGKGRDETTTARELLMSAAAIPTDHGSDTSEGFNREPGRRRKRLRIALALLPFVGFAFWFVTAPACNAIQRIVSGTEPRALALLIRNAAESYQARLARVDKIPVLKRMTDSLEELWWQVLDPPETTP